MSCLSSTLLWVCLSIKWHTRRNQVWIFKFNVNSILTASIPYYSRNSQAPSKEEQQTKQLHGQRWAFLDATSMQPLVPWQAINVMREASLKNGGSQFEGTVPHDRDMRAAVPWRSWMHCSHSQGAEKDGSYLVCLLIFIQSGILAYGLVRTTFWMGLLTSINR